jgi:alpha 1,2-mannosyltransferase
LLSTNYLQIGENAHNVDVFLFHTGDFDGNDLGHLESILSSSRAGILKMVNLNNTGFWELPPWHRMDVRSDWVDPDIFPVGYRHMCRWFGVKIWQFFDEMNDALGCKYRYLLRIDEDSLIHSPIQYDIFDFMSTNQYVYGYRLCAYELDYNPRIAPWLNRWKTKNPLKRETHRGLCGFYNNFFVADLHFFTSPPVAKYIKTIDRQGFIYRKRYGDLMIHSHAVYGYADATQIHRFLDFTYEHVTRDHVLHPEQGCVVWGGIQEGYLDPKPEKALNLFFQDVLNRKCTANITRMREIDLSPTYQHIPVEWRGKVELKTIVAGKVELPGQGIDSG